LIWRSGFWFGPKAVEGGSLELVDELDSFVRARAARGMMEKTWDLPEENNPLAEDADERDLEDLYVR